MSWFTRAGLAAAARSSRTVLWPAAAMAAIAVVFSACSTDNPLSLRPDVDIGLETAAVPAIDMPLAETPDNPPSETYLAAYPRPEAPDEFTPADPGMEAMPDDQGFGEVPQEEPETRQVMIPADEAACRRELERLSVTYENLPSINDGGVCRVDYPVKVAAIGSVRLKPAATLNCQMALAFATWTRKELVPAARTRYFSGVKTIHQGSSYSCRNVRGSGKPSEHARGNALDIGRIELNSGRAIEVEKQGLFAFRSKGFLNSIRSDGCEYFNTVLGPGYDHDHRNHFHFDIRQRRNGYRACH